MTSFHTAFASGALVINYMNNFTLCTFTPVKMTEYKEQDQLAKIIYNVFISFADIVSMILLRLQSYNGVIGQKIE